MLQIVISIAIFIYAILDYKKGLIAFLAFQVAWFKDAQVFNIPGLASVNIDLVMDSAFLLLFLIKKKKLVLSRVRFPLIIPFAILGISWFLSCFGSVTDFAREFVRTAGNIVIKLLFVAMLWYVIDKHQDYERLYRLITVIVFAACVFSIFESITHSNPILDYKKLLTNYQLSTYNANEYALAYRGYRAYSFFEHTITTSLIYGFYIVFTLSIVVLYNEKTRPKWLTAITCIMCVPGILLTKMRTGIFFVLLGLFLELRDFPFFISKKRLLKMTIITIIALIVIIPFLNKYAILVLSIFNSNAQASIGGSSFSWRLIQAKNIFDIGKGSFFVGYGEKFRNLITTSRKYTGDFESIWFEQYLAHGLFGIISYIILIYYTTVKLAIDYETKYLRRFSITYWITYTMTSLPYFRTYLFYLCIFYFVKKTEKYKKRNDTACI